MKLIWPFGGAQRQPDAVSDPSSGFPSFKRFAVNGACMKVRLSEKAAIRLRWTAKSHGITNPDLLRALVFIHLYGHAAYFGLVEYGNRTKAAREREADSLASLGITRIGHDELGKALAGRLESLPEVQFSTYRSGSRDVDEPVYTGRALRANVQMHGLNEEEFEFELPNVMRSDLIGCAGKAGKQGAVYLRETLISMLFGEKIAADWVSYSGA